MKPSIARAMQHTLLHAYPVNKKHISPIVATYMAGKYTWAFEFLPNDILTDDMVALAITSFGAAPLLYVNYTAFPSIREYYYSNMLIP